MELLDGAGYADRVGRVYMANPDDPIRPLDLIPHQEGLPEFDVCIAPEHTPAVRQTLRVAHAATICSGAI